MAEHDQEDAGATDQVEEAVTLHSPTVGRSAARICVPKDLDLEVLP